MCRAYLLLLFLICSGCGGTVLPLYEEQRLAALAEALPAPSSWTPDGRIAISERMLQTIGAESTKTAQQGNSKLVLSGPGFSSHPSFKLQKLSLAQGDCTQCFALTASFVGDVTWRLLTKSGTSPFTAEASIQAEVLIEQDKLGWHIRLKPKDIEHVKLETKGWSSTLNAALAKPLERWLKTQIGELLPEIPLADLPESSLPVRAARARSIDGALVVEFLTPAGTAETMQPVKLRKGWSVDLSTEALIAIARADSFRKGPDSHGIVVTPITFKPNRQAFELEMRIWRLKGAGWWRDYRVSGEIEAKPGAIKLTSNDVLELDQSAGAAFVDPLAALGEALIIKAIEDAITTSLPSTKSVDIGGAQIQLTVQTLGGSGAFLKVGGATKLH